MSQLFIFIEAQSVRWLEFDSQSRIALASGTSASLEQLSLPDRFSGQSAVLVVATEWVLLHKVSAPKELKTESLPWLIESQLFTDVEQQYCYDCGYSEEQRTIALLDKSLLDQWFEAIFERGLTIKALLPDAWLLPVSEGVTSLLQQGERLLLAREDKMAAALPEALSESALDELVSARVDAWGLAPRQRDIWRASRELREYPAVDDLPLWLANNWQGEIGILPKHLQVKPPRKMPGYLKFAALGIALFAMIAVSGWLSLQELREDSARSQAQYQAQLQQYPQYRGMLANDVSKALKGLQREESVTLDHQLGKLSQLLELLPKERVVGMHLEQHRLEIRLDTQQDFDVLALANTFEQAHFVVNWRAADQILTLENPFENQ